MESMTIRFISAMRTNEGGSRARLRVESKARHGNEPEISMSVVLNLPPEGPGARPLPERAYDELLRYLDIA